MYPGSVAEVIALGRYAYEVSRYCGAWSALKIVTEVADAYQTVPAVDERHFVRPEFTWRDAPWKATQHITLQPVHTDPLEIEIRTGRIEAARRFADVNEIDRVAVDPSDASLLIVTPGRVVLRVPRCVEPARPHRERSGEQGRPRLQARTRCGRWRRDASLTRCAA